MVKPHQAKRERESDVALMGSYYFQFTCSAPIWEKGNKNFTFAFLFVWCGLTISHGEYTHSRVFRVLMP